MIYYKKHSHVMLNMCDLFFILCNGSFTILVYIYYTFFWVNHNKNKRAQEQILLNLCIKMFTGEV